MACVQSHNISLQLFSSPVSKVQQLTDPRILHKKRTILTEGASVYFAQFEV